MLRVPTANLFQQQMNTMNQGSYKLANLIQQSGNNKALQSPSDDLVLANRITLTINYMTELDSYTQNDTIAQNRMQLFEQSMKSSVNIVSQIQSLMQQASNDAVSDAGRRDIAEQINGYLQTLLNAANTQDADGSYIYAGSNSNITPYTQQNGSYVYEGSYTSTNINIGPNVSSIYNQVGNDIFGNILLGNGTFTVTANTSNAGSASTTAGSVVSNANYVADTYTLSFVTNSAGKLAYKVVGTNSGQVIPQPPADAPAYEPNAAITFNGISLNVSGTPAVGDSFDIAPSQYQNVFNTIQNVVQTLQTSTADANGQIDPVKQAQLHQQLSQLSAAFVQINQSMISNHAEIGVQSGEVDNQVTLNQATISSQMAIWQKLAIVSPYQTLSEIQQQQVVLETASGVYKQLQEMFMRLMQV